MTQKTTFTFTDDEIKILEELRNSMGARSMNEVVRRSIAQSSALRKQADEDGNVTIENPDGHKVILPMRW